MKKAYVILFFILSIQVLSQSSYRPKFLVEVDFPRRFQIGVKLLSSKKLSYTLKVGYQVPCLRWGGYSSSNLELGKQLGLIGPLAGIGTEFNLKNPSHKISLEVEYSNLTGGFSDPDYLSSGGRDYMVTYSTVKAQSFTSLLGYYYHFNSNYNLSVFIKVGLIYRDAKEHIYFSGYRSSNSQNQLKAPIDKQHYEKEFTSRIGIQYCFGHSKLAPPYKKPEKYGQLNKTNNFNLVKNYLNHTDSLTYILFVNYQYTTVGIEIYKDLKKDLLHWLKRHRNVKDSLLIDEKINFYKNLIEKELSNRTMKVDSYKKVIQLKDGTTKIKRKHVDYYNRRYLKKYKPLYEKYRLY